MIEHSQYGDQEMRVLNEVMAIQGDVPVFASVDVGANQNTMDVSTLSQSIERCIAAMTPAEQAVARRLLQETVQSAEIDRIRATASKATASHLHAISQSEDMSSRHLELRLGYLFQVLSSCRSNPIPFLESRPLLGGGVFLNALDERIQSLPLHQAILINHLIGARLRNQEMFLPRDKRRRRKGRQIIGDHLKAIWPFISSLEDEQKSGDNPVVKPVHILPAQFSVADEVEYVLLSQEHPPTDDQNATDTPSVVFLSNRSMHSSPNEASE